MTAKVWRVVLGSEAERDFLRILAYTRDAFGPRQESLYETTILAAIAELGSGPEIPGSLARHDLRPGIRSLHIARHHRKGRHVIFYRSKDEDVIEIIRILHDAMDFAQHVSAAID